MGGDTTLEQRLAAMDFHRPIQSPVTKKAQRRLRGSESPSRQLHSEPGVMLFGDGALAEKTLWKPAERSSTPAAHCDSFCRRKSSGRSQQERLDQALHLLFATEVAEPAQPLGDSTDEGVPWTGQDNTNTEPSLRTASDPLPNNKVNTVPYPEHAFAPGVARCGLRLPFLPRFLAWRNLVPRCRQRPSPQQCVGINPALSHQTHPLARCRCREGLRRSATRGAALLRGESPGETLSE